MAEPFSLVEKTKHQQISTLNLFVSKNNLQTRDMIILQGF